MKNIATKMTAISVAAIMATAGIAMFTACDSDDTETSTSTNSSTTNSSSTNSSSTNSSSTNSSSAADSSSTSDSSVIDSSVTDSSADGSSSASGSDVTIDYSGYSGELNVYMPSPKGIQTKLKAEFEELTGIMVNIVSGTTGEILTALEAEGDNHWADVVILASWSDGLSLKEDGVLMSYQSPYAEYMHDGFVDDDYMLYGTSASAVGVIYNTKYYTAEDLESLDWSDYANSAYKDEIAIPNPQSSGACKDFIAGFVSAIDTDYSIIDSWADNGLYNAGGNSNALALVEAGTKPILLAGVDYNAYSAIADGESIAIYYPESGTVINPRPAMIMNTAPHADNAKVFIDYLMSDSAQKIVADAYLIPGRADVDSNSARLGFDDIKQYEVDWTKMMAVSDEAAQYVVDKTAGNN